MNSLKILYGSGRSIALAVAIFWGVLFVPFYMATAEDEEETVDKASVEKVMGTVDAVAEGRLVINDSTVFLDGKVQLYDKYGNSASLDLFEEGDQVNIAYAEDEKAGARWIVSISLVKKGSGKKQDAFSGQEKPKGSDGILEGSDGVWRN